MNIQFTDFKKLRNSIRKYGISFFKQIKQMKQKINQIKEFENKGLDINDLSDIFSTNKGELFVILSLVKRICG